MPFFENKHPEYDLMNADWILMRDCAEGQRKIKEKTTDYLPATSGHREDGYPNTNAAGTHAYNAYVTRAYFHDFVSDAILAALGVMHQKEATILLPKGMEYLREKATQTGQSLQLLIRKINQEQLEVGRYGIMADLPKNGSDEFYLVGYKTETIVNWNEGSDVANRKLKYLVLDESSDTMDEKSGRWSLLKKYRKLTLDENGNYSVEVINAPDNSEQVVVDFETNPKYKGKLTQEIPFRVINTTDIDMSVQKPPLVGLANLAVAVYRGEADYRQSLFMQGQDTFVTSGAHTKDGKPTRVGAGAQVNLPLNGTAEYVGVASKGLTEQRIALENDKREAGQKGGQLLDSTTRERESGDALGTRMYAQTATLHSIAISSARAVESVLKQIASWMGLDPSEVVVKPNLDFTNVKLDGNNLVAIATAKNIGMPLSAKSFHNLLQNQDLTQLSFEEEVAEIEAELIIPVGVNKNEEPEKIENDPGTVVDDGSES